MNFFKNTYNLIKILKNYNRNIEVVKSTRQCFCTKTNQYEIDLKIRNISLNNYISHLYDEFKELSDGTTENSNSRRWSELRPVIKILNERKSVVDNLISVQELLNEKDEDIRKLAEEEKEQFENKLKQLDDDLVTSLIPNNTDEEINSVVLEVKAGVGGQEAMLFAKEIFEMYCNFCEYKGWNVEIAEYLTTEIGGIRHATALVDGQSVFRYFRHEAGVHRVQRTPATEKAGRIHTSTISVICLPQPTDIQININPKDLKIETKRSSGAGGQHVNTTDSCVRITHVPSGISVECQVDRSQIKNRKFAMARLNALLYQRELESQIEETKTKRKSQVRSNFRNEKIRTYNFNQDRITDHRLIDGGSIHNLKGFFEGGGALEQLIETLDDQNREEELIEIVENFNKNS